MQKEISLQEWLPFERILCDGIIELKELEKIGILNSYKTFLKTCNFDIQILVQSNKEDLSKHILKIKETVKKENDLKLYKISEKYIDFITNLNNEKKSSSKNFYIIIKYKQNDKYKITKEEIIISELNERFFKIKECLSRCGNIANEIYTREEIRNILFTFLNSSTASKICSLI